VVVIVVVVVVVVVVIVVVVVAVVAVADTSTVPLPPRDCVMVKMQFSGCGYEGFCLPGLNTVLSGKSQMIFRRNT
jgi:hypothetical protein